MRLEDLYANQPNVLSLIEKYQKEATELGISLAGYSNRSIFFSVPLSPTIPDDKEVAAFIQDIADKADFPLKTNFIFFFIIIKNCFIMTCYASVAHW